MITRTAACATFVIVAIIGGAWTFTELTGPPRDACQVQIQNSEERLRSEAKSADARLARLERMIAQAEQLERGLRTAWAVAVLNGEEVQP